MKIEAVHSRVNRKNCQGFVLLVTLVLLVVLSTLGYTLSSRIAAQRHREQYMIDYQIACYGRDSAIKYAFVTLENITPKLISRPNEPDFSDLFILGEEQYKALLAQWAATPVSDGSGSFNDINDINNISDLDSLVRVRDVNDTNSVDNIVDFSDPNSLRMRGPYGPPWPFIVEPVEFKIGSATVRIEIEDENAKYPLGWAAMGGNDVQFTATAALETFCEWMGFKSEQIDSLEKQLKKIREVKPFKLKFEQVVESKTVRTRLSTPNRRTRTPAQTTTTVAAPATIHITDFSKLFHSSLIDMELLATPTIISDTRKESALKYMGMWGSSTVNINTAPRHVLEAAFTFGGDADKIAEQIIQRRRIKPFTDIEDFRKSLFRYSDSIGKCSDYITTTSGFFTIRITAISGVAKASAIIAVTKDDKKVQRIALVSG